MQIASDINTLIVMLRTAATLLADPTKEVKIHDIEGIIRAVHKLTDMKI